MAPRRGAALTVPNRSLSLQSLLGVAREVLQQTARGLDPALSTSALATAVRAATALTSELTDGVPYLHEFAALWSQPGQDAAAYLAFFSLALRRCGVAALRRSSLSIIGEGRGHVYTGIVVNLSRQLGRVCYSTEPVPRGHIRRDLLAAAVLRADALECYSRVLADAAEKLKPAAAAAPPEHSRCGEGSATVGDSREDAVATAAGECLQLTNSVHTLISALISGIFQSASGSGGGSSTGGSSSGGGGNGGSGGSRELDSGGSRELDSGGSGSTASATIKHGLVHDFQAQLHSSWVLEHWAQVLLLTSAVASARGSGEAQVIACAAQARLLKWLCRAKDVARFSFARFLRRPCGCALAATHMAQLCAVLDGGDAFGATKPEVLVMPPCPQAEFRYLLRVDRTAKKYDDVAMRLGRAVNLHAAISTAELWNLLLLESKTLKEPPCKAAGGCGVGACPAEAVSAGREAAGASQQAVSAGQEGAGASQQVVSAGQEGAGASQQAVSAGQGGAESGGSDVRLALEEGHTAADTCRGKLPPFNHTATFHLCLRLAKGLLACWGRPLSGVRLEQPSHNPSAPAPLLPKEQSCALLHKALACSRLALLPAVWGRERVPRRRREQLRAWWEAYVAAAQHPEALLVGQPEPPDYPDWTWQQPVFGVGPSADAAAAVEAGLLPCIARMVGRIGAGGGGITWCPPSFLPGVQPCLEDALQFGPLGQVGELLSAVGRRLRGAVEEQRAAAAQGGVAEEGGGERAWWLENVVRQAMMFTMMCMYVLVVRWHQAAATCAADTDVPQEAGAHLAQQCVGRAPAVAAAQFAVRSSIALAELLPGLSHGVQLYAELLAGRGSGGAEGSGQGGGRAEAAREVEDEGREPEYNAGALLNIYKFLGCALDCATVLLAKLCREASEERHGSGGSGGGGDDAAAVGAGGGGGDGGGAPGDVDPAWRQLLLRDVRLMELLGAGVALLHGHLPSDADCCALRDTMRTSLSTALQLASVTFPAEFRAAVEGGARVSGAAGTGSAAGAGSGAGDGSGGAGARRRRSMSLAALRAVLAAEAGAGGEAAAGGDGGEGASPGGDGECLEVVVRVLGGWDPSPGEAWEVACRCWRGHARKMGYAEALGEVVEVLRGMPGPGEARAAVAAAVTAAVAEA